MYPIEILIYIVSIQFEITIQFLKTVLIEWFIL